MALIKNTAWKIVSLSVRQRTQNKQQKRKNIFICKVKIIQCMANMVKIIKNQKKVVQYQNGQIVCIYDSIKEAKDKTGIVQISNSCTYYNKGELWWKQNRSGRPSKSAGGYVWKYLSDVSDDERLVYIIKKLLIEVNENEKK